MFQHTRDETEGVDNSIMAEGVEAKETKETERGKTGFGVCAKWSGCECNFLSLQTLPSTH
jgi:hypothetical protein